MKWDDKIQVQKGNVGEQIVFKLLEDKGYVVYRPITEKAHAFDNLAIKDKKTVMIAEVKTKARRNNYYDTGINLSHYEEYKYIYDTYKIPVFIFFVDEMEKTIYGNYLDILEKPYNFIARDNYRSCNYPLIQGNIIYFNLDKMKVLCELENNVSEQLKNLSTRNYKYINDYKPKLT